MRLWSIPSLWFSSLSLALLVATTAGQAQDGAPPPTAKPPTVPTFEKLPRKPYPNGRFIAWCGNRERYLLSSDDQYIDAYDGGTKISAPSPTGDRSVQCGAEGDYIVFPEYEEGRIRKFELMSGKSTILATFDRGEPSISFAFSPDMKSVASNKPLQWTAEAGQVRTINVPEIAGQSVAKIVWSPDGSKFFVAYFDAIDVFDAQGNRIGGGKNRKFPGIDTGWFGAEQKSLFLFILSDEIQSIGPLLRCRIVEWRCVQLRERVTMAGGGGKGLIALVAPIDRPKLADDDTSVLYRRYSAELRDDSFRLVFRQEFSWAAGQTGPSLSVSPTGATAILSWMLTNRANCPDNTNEKCAERWILDIGKAIK